LAYSIYLGGSAASEALTVDANGKVYVTGDAESVDSPRRPERSIVHATPATSRTLMPS